MTYDDSDEVVEIYLLRESSPNAFSSKLMDWINHYQGKGLRTEVQFSVDSGQRHALILARKP